MLTSVSTLNPFRGLAAQPMDDVEFTATTVIFGRNGAGKTTLGDLLQHLGPDRSFAKDLESLVVRPSGEVGTVRAFNQQYIDANLRSFLDGDGETHSIAIGRESIELEDEKSQLAEVSTTRRGWRSQVSAKLQANPTDSSIGDAAKQALISQLAVYDASKYHTTMLRNDARFRSRIAAVVDRGLSVDDLEAHRTTAGASELQRVDVISAPAAIKLLPDFNVIAETLSTSPGEKLAGVLLDRAGFKDWLGEGLSHFDEETDPLCPFCRQATQADRISAIRQAFDDALVSTEESIDNHLKSIQDVIDAANEVKGKALAIAGLAPIVDAKYTVAKNKLALQLTGFIEGLESWRNALNSKKSNIRATPSAPKIISAIPDLKICSDLLVTHNSEVSNQASSTNDALIALEDAELFKYRTQMEDAERIRTKLERCASALDRSIEGLENRLIEIAAIEQDTHEMAEALTQDIRLILGNTSLTIGTSLDGKKYKISRGSTPACHLSAGERNIIALTYFLRTLAAKDCIPAETTVIMDDPVSSLDRENAISAFTMIEDRASNWKQLIMLTHEYDFLRFCVTSWPVNDKHPNVTHLEVAKKWNVTLERTESFLRPLPTELSKFSSEYHYLFSLIVACALGEVDSMMLSTFGNSARRLLEGFMSFIRPVTPELRNSLVSAWAEAENVEELSPIRDRALKFANETSHHVRTSPMYSTPVPAVPGDFACVLYVMKVIAPSHFKEMAQMISRPNKTSQVLVSGLFRDFEAARKRVMNGVASGLTI